MEIVRRLREQKGLTQKKLGELVGVSESMIGMIENGKRNPGFEVLLKLGEALDCTVDDLMNDKKEPATDGDGLVKEPYDKWADKDVRLLKWFRSLPVEKQKAILLAQDAPTDLV